MIDGGLDNFEEETKKRNKLIKKWTDLLLESGIDYSLKSWDSGEGMTIIIKPHINTGDKLVYYPLEINISDNCFVSFDLPQDIEKFIIEEYGKVYT